MPVAARTRVGRRHAQRSGDAGDLLRLHRIELMIAAQHQRDHAAVRAVDDQRLDAAVGGDAEQRADLGDGARAGRGDLLRAAAAGAGRRAAEGSVGASSRLAA